MLVTVSKGGCAKEENQEPHLTAVGMILEARAPSRVWNTGGV